MATQQTVPHSLSVVPFPAVEPITQLELTVFLSLRGRLYQLEEQVKQADSPLRLGSRIAPHSSPAIVAPNSRKTSAVTSQGKQSSFAWSNAWTAKPTARRFSTLPSQPAPSLW